MRTLTKVLWLEILLEYKKQRADFKRSRELRKLHKHQELARLLSSLRGEERIGDDEVSSMLLDSRLDDISSECELSGTSSVSLEGDPPTYDEVLRMAAEAPPPAPPDTRSFDTHTCKHKISNAHSHNEAQLAKLRSHICYRCSDDILDAILAQIKGYYSSRAKYAKSAHKSVNPYDGNGFNQADLERPQNDVHEDIKQCKAHHIQFWMDVLRESDGWKNYLNWKKGWEK